MGRSDPDPTIDRRVGASLRALGIRSRSPSLVLAAEGRSPDSSSEGASRSLMVEYEPTRWVRILLPANGSALPRIRLRVAVIACGLFGIDEIGIGIEELFGDHTNDLPMDGLDERSIPKPQDGKGGIHRQASPVGRCARG